MALSPSHRNRPAPDDVTFVGRRRELEILEGAIRQPLRPDEYRVVSVYGRGGLGKSSLIERFRRRYGSGDPEVQIAFVDLGIGENRDPVHALLDIRNQLRARGVRTYTFDLAFARNFALTRVGRDIRADYPELFLSGRDLLGDLTEVVGSVWKELPGGKLVFDTLAHLSAHCIDWYRRRGRRMLDTLDELTGADLRASLPSYLGFDICSFIEEHASGRPVIIIDTFEALWRDGGGLFGPGSSTPDAWVRSLVQEAPGTTFVICGRRKLGWGEIDAAWNDVITDCELEELSVQEQLRFLRTKGVAQPALLDSIIHSSRGHALTLNLHARTHQNLIAIGREPVPSDFPSTLRQTLDRFVDHLPTSLRTLLRLASVPSELHQPMWDYLARSFAVFAMHSYSETVGDVFFRSVGSDRHVLHEQVREHLLADVTRADAATLRSMRLALFDYFSRASSWNAEERRSVGENDSKLDVTTRDRFLVEAVEQLAAADRERAAEWSLERLGDGMMHGGGTRQRRHLLDLTHACLRGMHSTPLDLTAHLADLEIIGNPLSDEARTVATLLADRLDEAADLSETTLDHAVDVARSLSYFGESDVLGRLLRRLSPAVEGRPRRAGELLVAATNVGDRSVAETAFRAWYSGRPLEVVELHSALSGALMMPSPRMLKKVLASELGKHERWVTLARTLDTLQLLERLDQLPAVLQTCFGSERIEDVALAIKQSAGAGSAARCAAVLADCLRTLGDDAGVKIVLEARQPLDDAVESVTRHELRSEEIVISGSEIRMPVGTVSFRADLVISERGEVYLFHAQPTFAWRGSDYLALAGNRLFVFDRRVGLVDFGVPLPERLLVHLGRGFRILVVVMDQLTGMPVHGRHAIVFDWNESRIVSTGTLQS